MSKIAIVVSKFNYEITKMMLENAIESAKKNKLKIVEVAEVPGAYDMPLVVQRLARKKEIEGIVCLGAIVKGGTEHDKIIAQSLAKTLMDLSLKYNKPITLGVIGPNATYKQAKERAIEYSNRAILAARDLIEVIKKI
ncbi:MAG: 6,7-dimethyl-8-ribityllumazine synthase [Candidatus Anstonellaceae archaeon]